jgi:hypothetical protein
MIIFIRTEDNMARGRRARDFAAIVAVLCKSDSFFFHPLKGRCNSSNWRLVVSVQLAVGFTGDAVRVSVFRAAYHISEILWPRGIETDGDRRARAAWTVLFVGAIRAHEWSIAAKPQPKEQAQTNNPIATKNRHKKGVVCFRL